MASSWLRVGIASRLQRGDLPLMAAAHQLTKLWPTVVQDEARTKVPPAAVGVGVGVGVGLGFGVIN